MVKLAAGIHVCHVGFLLAVLELRVIRSKSERLNIIRSMHDGLGSSQEAKALAGHIGRDKTISKLLVRSEVVLILRQLYLCF